MRVAEDSRLLALIPSAGLGGGIEAYVDAVLEQLEKRGAVVDRRVLLDARRRRRPTTTGKLAYAIKVLRRALQLRGLEAPRVLVFHPSFILLGLLAGALCRAAPEVTVFFYGSEIFSATPLRRWLWGRPRLKLVTISSFSAGALATVGPARLLPPGVGQARYRALLSLPAPSLEPGSPVQLLSVFRLADAAGKGAYEVLAATGALRARGLDVQLTLAGVGPAPADLLAAVDKVEWASVVASPTESELVTLYGSSDVFVLATRLRSRGHPCGEGFGIVLVEAALACRPVVAPAFGGSSDAILRGITGLQPVDESVDALIGVLEWVVEHPADVGRMATNARRWAARRFSPDHYGELIGQQLLGRPFEGDVALAITSER